MQKHFNITIQGKVQGVWYRASAQAAARQLGLVGFVKNLPDGYVYADVWSCELIIFTCRSSASTFNRIVFGEVCEYK